MLLVWKARAGQGGQKGTPDVGSQRHLLPDESLRSTCDLHMFNRGYLIRQGRLIVPSTARHPFGQRIDECAFAGTGWIGTTWIMPGWASVGRTYQVFSAGLRVQDVRAEHVDHHLGSDVLDDADLLEAVCVKGWR